MKHHLPGGYYVASDLKAHHQGALVELLFFNRNQFRMRGPLRNAVARYGTPQIRRHGDRLSLGLPGIPEVQTLYLFKENLFPDLVGLVVYAREGSVLRVVYVGLDPNHDYTAGKHDYVLLEIFDILRQIGRRIRGVDAVEFTSGRRDFRLRTLQQ